MNADIESAKTLLKELQAVLTHIYLKYRSRWDGVSPNFQAHSDFRQAMQHLEILNHRISGMNSLIAKIEKNEQKEAK